MDLEKIGKLIAKKRQENNFTQESLAEELDISNRSISKWERGICLPDANNMAKLCKLFNISYNELLSGEELKKADYENKAEKLLEEFAKVETAQNKKFFIRECHRLHDDYPCFDCVFYCELCRNADLDANCLNRAWDNISVSWWKLLYQNRN